MSIDSKKKAELRRKYHIRKKIFGTPTRPRLCVFRSNRHIYAQVIDDIAGATLVSASTNSGQMKKEIDNGSNKKAAGLLGEKIAKEAIAVGLSSVCFDRRGYKFHGRTKALADAARKAGLRF